MLAKTTIGGMRDAGKTKVSDLVKEAMLNPDLMKALLSKVPIKPGAGSEITLRNQLARLTMMGAFQGARQGKEQSSPAPQTSAPSGKGMTWPQAIATEISNIGKGVYSAATLPGDVLAGRVDPASDEGIARTVGLAGMMVGGGRAPLKYAENGKVLASSTPLIYNPLGKALRPLAKDYPNGAEFRPDGRIARDVEGRELNAPFVAGRVSGTGAEQAITPAQYDAISEAALGGPSLGVSKSRLGSGRVGAFERTVVNNEPNYAIKYDKSLGPNSQNLVIAHEIAHAVDELSSRIDAEPLKALWMFDPSLIRERFTNSRAVHGG